jgi:hypothetical protein
MNAIFVNNISHIRSLYAVLHHKSRKQNISEPWILAPDLLEDYASAMVSQEIDRARKPLYIVVSTLSSFYGSILSCLETTSRAYSDET